VQVQREWDFANNQGSNGKLPEALERAESFKRIRLKGGTICAAEIIPEEVKWLWLPWLAREEMAILDGLPGQGKGLLTMDLAARITRGWPMPPEPRPNQEDDRVFPKPASVVILTAEDNWKTQMVPRLMAADADLSKVFRPEKEFLAFPKDLHLVEDAVREKKAKLLIIDPVMNFIGDGKTGWWPTRACKAWRGR
jgi:hypothetical protein